MSKIQNLFPAKQSLPLFQIPTPNLVAYLQLEVNTAFCYLFYFKSCAIVLDNWEEKICAENASM